MGARECWSYRYHEVSGLAACAMKINIGDHCGPNWGGIDVQAQEVTGVSAGHGSGM